MKITSLKQALELVADLQEYLLELAVGGAAPQFSTPFPATLSPDKASYNKWVREHLSCIPKAVESLQLNQTFDAKEIAFIMENQGHAWHVDCWRNHCKTYFISVFLRKAYRGQTKFSNGIILRRPGGSHIAPRYQIVTYPVQENPDTIVQ